ncbi:RNA polymerase subunit sigma [Clostridium butyricum]|uniref:RNA polymerase subunit sigma n=1 Tax=Clostridium butyricum TaxID=1492 RepID=UPI0013D0606E|nr:RNA polymerase subunit sigma [Clostridium butyricum]MCQ2017269.1 RNA polymerase subunit sigma [Clostridium butyricum]MCQ2021142.1 RNA polymerase subunit sigma [Clostridium butyricum]NFB72498.1 RNA polymerase subunit sigma [Clostridium butyricum]NFB91577.1 RNA polymerase subunit sigma [Clostridium butyricum]UTY53592.1 RNA polymerase subunit sigma [Clostridium butyricum]
MSNNDSILGLDLALTDEEKDRRYVSKLNRNIDRVKYLRIVKYYTQEKTADIAGISVRQVQRIDKKLKIK